MSPCLTCYKWDCVCKSRCGDDGMKKLDLEKFAKELKEFLNDKIGDDNYDLNLEEEEGLTFFATLAVWNHEVIE